jgi:hypothetical protein
MGGQDGSNQTSRFTFRDVVTSIESFIRGPRNRAGVLLRPASASLAAHRSPSRAPRPAAPTRPDPAPVAHQNHLPEQIPLDDEAVEPGSIRRQDDSSAHRGLRRVPSKHVARSKGQRKPHRLVYASPSF